MHENGPKRSPNYWPNCDVNSLRIYVIRVSLRYQLVFYFINEPILAEKKLLERFRAPNPAKSLWMLLSGVLLYLSMARSTVSALQTSPLQGRFISTSRFSVFTHFILIRYFCKQSLVGCFYILLPQMWMIYSFWTSTSPKARKSACSGRDKQTDEYYWGRINKGTKTTLEWVTEPLSVFLFLFWGEGGGRVNIVKASGFFMVANSGRLYILGTNNVVNTLFDVSFLWFC